MLPVASHRDCSRVNGRLVQVDERSMVCAGGQGKGGCQVSMINVDEHKIIQYFSFKKYKKKAKKQPTAIPVSSATETK